MAKADYKFPGAEEDKYQAFLAKHKLQESDDYDMRGAYKYGLKPDARGHMGDEFKKDNHITYSTDTLRSKDKDAPPAGRWVGDDKKGWEFHASDRNIENAGGVGPLKEYFSRVEPGTKLRLPPSKVSGDVVDDGNPAKRRRIY